MKKFIWLFLLLAGCANQPTQPRYADAVLNRPLPATDEQVAQECAWIRSEIARQQTLGNYGASMATTPLMAVAYRAAAQQNVAALESRAANVRCTAAFSNAPASSRSFGDSLDFEQCMNRCAKHTSRTKEECFDACIGGKR